jgi:PAS domain S-box-containing protein
MSGTGKSSMPFLALIIVFAALVLAMLFSIPLLIDETSADHLIKLKGIGLSVTVSELLFVIGLFVSASITAVLHYRMVSRHRVEAIADSKVEELLKSRDFFLKLFEDSPVPYFMVSDTGEVVLPNKASLRLFQMTADEIMQYRFNQVIDDEHTEKSRTIYDKFIRGVASSDVEVEVVRKDGVKRWVRLSALPYRMLGGKGKGGTVSMLDITEQKAIDKVKTEFVSLASHQLRTPLSAMKWYGEMVLQGKDPLSEKQKRHIGKIYKANQRMIELVELLLSASRLELGSFHVEITQVNPVETVKELLEEVQKTISDKQLQIVENYSGDFTNYYSDKKLIHMVLQNLITNAVKYTNDNGVVQITLEAGVENLLIEVEDNGLGIPLEQQEKIFSKMFRADNARLKVADGNGLGLYIVKEAVERLGGEIGFTSVLNEGTIFTATIPSGTSGSGSKS